MWVDIVDSYHHTQRRWPAFFTRDRDELLNFGQPLPGDVDEDNVSTYGTELLFERAFQCFVERLLPGKGNIFGIRVIEHSGVYGEETATTTSECAYLVVKEFHVSAGTDVDDGDDFCGNGRGGVNVP